MRRAAGFARRWPYALKCDVRKYFPSIDHEVLHNENNLRASNRNNNNPTNENNNIGFRVASSLAGVPKAAT